MRGRSTGLARVHPPCTKVHQRRPGHLLDELIRLEKDCARDRDAEGFSRFHVDHQLEACGLLDRHVRRLGALQDLDDVRGGAAPHLAYELSGPQALSYGAAADILSKVLGSKVNYVGVPDDAARAGMLASGMPDFYADHLLDLFVAYRDGAGSQLTSDVKNITGRDAISFEQFVRDHAGAFRGAGAAMGH